MGIIIFYNFRNFFVYYTTEELQQQPGISISSLASKSEVGRFVHHPFGIPPVNPIAYSKATLPHFAASHNVSPTPSISLSNNIGTLNGNNAQYASSGALVYGGSSASSVQYHYGNPSTSTSTPNRLAYNNCVPLNSASTPVGVYLSNGAASGQLINGYSSGHPASQLSSGTTHYLIHQSPTANSNTAAAPFHIQYQNQQYQPHAATSSVATSSAATIQYVSATPSLNTHSVGNVASATSQAPTYQIIYQHSQATPSVPVQQYVQATINGATVYVPAGAQYQTYVINPNGTVSANAAQLSTMGAGSTAPSTSGASSLHQIIVHQQPSTATPQSYVSTAPTQVYVQQTASHYSQSAPSASVTSVVNEISSGSSYATTGLLYFMLIFITFFIILCFLNQLFF